MHSLDAPMKCSIMYTWIVTGDSRCGAVHCRSVNYTHIGIVSAVRVFTEMKTKETFNAIQNS